MLGVAVLLLCSVLVLGYEDTVLYRSKIDSNDVNVADIRSSLGDHLSVNASQLDILSVVRDTNNIVIRVKCLGSSTESAILMTQRLVDSLGTSTLLRQRLQITGDVPLVCMSSVDGITCSTMPECHVLKEPAGIVLIVVLALALLALLWLALLFISFNSKKQSTEQPVPNPLPNLSPSQESSVNPSLHMHSSTDTSLPPSPAPVPTPPAAHQAVEAKEKDKRRKTKTPSVKIIKQPQVSPPAVVCKTKVPVPQQQQQHSEPTQPQAPQAKQSQVEHPKKTPEPSSEMPAKNETVAIQTTPQKEKRPERRSVSTEERGVSAGGGTVVSASTGTETMPPQAQEDMRLRTQEQYQEDIRPVGPQELYHYPQGPAHMHTHHELAIRDFSYIPDRIDSPEVHKHGIQHQPVQPVIDMASTMDSNDYQDRYYGGPITPNNRTQRQKHFTSPNYNDSDDQEVSDLTPLSNRHRIYADEEEGYRSDLRGHPLHYPQNVRKSFTKRYDM
eukprot:TRINITY_DN1181_c3_g2_i1.p1 TRINITY_DN1181_c3_g2~~TRINITY_DN1181_c3_g2_i1.p1  ORF type:complete len:500 (+),score=79.79 TRINITY_DN1181_c3_g2_i1:1130-2629(+)